MPNLTIHENQNRKTRKNEGTQLETREITHDSVKGATFPGFCQ